MSIYDRLITVGPACEYSWELGLKLISHIKQAFFHQTSPTPATRGPHMHNNSVRKSSSENANHERSRSRPSS